MKNKNSKKPKNKCRQITAKGETSLFKQELLKVAGRKY